MITEALESLKVELWRIEGNPTTEAEFNASFEKQVSQDSNGEPVFSSNPADFGVTWAQVQAEVTRLQAAEPLRLLRAERDRLIAETDWWASSDLTMTAEQRTYRQALRDITNTYSSLDDVVWPTKP